MLEKFMVGDGPQRIFMYYQIPDNGNNNDEQGADRQSD
jgi:hypothetical protein